MQKLLVYADFDWLQEPVLVGELSYESLRGTDNYGFCFDEEWLRTQGGLFLSADLNNYLGVQYTTGGDIFGCFSDTLPDRWGILFRGRELTYPCRFCWQLLVERVAPFAKFELCTLQFEVLNFPSSTFLDGSRRHKHLTTPERRDVFSLSSLQSNFYRLNIFLRRCIYHSNLGAKNTPESDNTKF